eukprot:COSAG04_NODE_185_length_21024_cov_49.557276_12_plen_143_part_00
MDASLDAVATRATINAGGVRDWSPLRTLPNKEHRFDPVVVEGGPFATKERERAKEAVLQAQRRMGDRDGSLDLSYCLLGDVVERALPPFLTLLKLNLTSCGLTPPAMEKVAAGKCSRPLCVFFRRSSKQPGQRCSVALRGRG